jgi:hypothetical protein
MKTLSVAAFLLFLCFSAVAQDATASYPAQGGHIGTQSEMPAGIETTLKKYISAYERRSMPELLALWPDLQNQKKEMAKIKQHFDDGNVSNEHMSLHPLQTQTLKEDAIVECERTEQFVKSQTVETGGDMMMGRYPAQNTGPHPTTKPVKRKDTVWMKLHKDHDDWVIVSVSDKQLSL